MTIVVTPAVSSPTGDGLERATSSGQVEVCTDVKIWRVG